MIYTFELIGLLFALIMMYFTYVEYKKSRLTTNSFVFWLVIWLGSVLLIFLHPYVNLILPTIRIVRVLDLYMIFAFMFLFCVIFYLFTIIKHVERRMETLVRQVALQKLKK